MIESQHHHLNSEELVDYSRRLGAIREDVEQLERALATVRRVVEGELESLRNLARALERRIVHGNEIQGAAAAVVEKAGEEDGEYLHPPLHASTVDGTRDA